MGSGSPIDDLVESGTIRLLDWNDSMIGIQLGMRFVDKVQAISTVLANDPEIPVSNIIQEVQVLFQTVLTIGHDHCPRDWRYFELQDILMRAGVQRAKDLKDHSLSSSNNPNNTQDSTNTAKSESQKNENKWIDQMHGNLLVTATLIATVSFQAAYLAGRFGHHPITSCCLGRTNLIQKICTLFEEARKVRYAENPISTN
ncbi:hypothetical protein M9H77_16821 [Catharanthus roseus]|uniref:Uncharacterized protein n=1 Tax=Catharanthus roseus TaxID=4058 RepID=A0ACC0B386_CATRO|nr:hypothetical protein M9H77_16821 [Catharanthus roseus]